MGWSEASKLWALLGSSEREPADTFQRTGITPRRMHCNLPHTRRCRQATIQAAAAAVSCASPTAAICQLAG